MRRRGRALRPHPLVRMQRARLASRTPRRSGLLEQKILWRSVFDCIRGEVGSRGSADLAVRSNSAKECDDTLIVGAQSRGHSVGQERWASLPGQSIAAQGRRVVQLLHNSDFLGSDLRATSQPIPRSLNQTLIPPPPHCGATEARSRGGSSRPPRQGHEATECGEAGCWVAG